jgi:hypothetical protein
LYIKGLREAGTIFVRQPKPSEKNDNDLLIRKGAIAVDFNGNAIKTEYPLLTVAEPQEKYKTRKENKQFFLFD